MKILDRYVVRMLCINYAIALAVMMSLYILLDLFVNIDEFTERDDRTVAALANVFQYYGSHSFLYFSQLSGAITLMACLTTLTRLRRGNELTAMLASGVSLYRVAVPVAAFGLTTSVLWYTDVEVAVPSVADRLVRAHEDASGMTERGVWFVRATPDSLLSAVGFIPARKEMRQMLVLFRDASGAPVRHIEADVARWEPVTGHPYGGVWRLERGVEYRRIVAPVESLGPRERIEQVPVDIYECPLTPSAIEVQQSQEWMRFASGSRLTQLAAQDPTLAPRVRRIKHTRFTTPLVHLLMLLLGLPFFLSREPANVIGDATKSAIVCGLCFVLAFVADHFVVSEHFSALPAWLPLILFTPVSVVLFDRLKT